MRKLNLPGRILHYLATASVDYLQNYCYGIGTRVAFEPLKETSSRSFPNLHLASLVKNRNIYPAMRVSFTQPDIADWLYQENMVKHLICLKDLTAPCSTKHSSKYKWKYTSKYQNLKIKTFTNLFKQEFLLSTIMSSCNWFTLLRAAAVLMIIS